MKKCCFTEGTGRFLRNRAWVLGGSHMRTCCFTKGTGRFLRHHDDCVEGRPVGFSWTQKGVSKMVFLGGSQLGMALYSGLPNAFASLKHKKVVRF